MKEPKIYFTAWKIDGTKKTWLKPTSRRIKVALASGKYKKYQLRVIYGKAKCAQGCICQFDNEMIGIEEDILWALGAFLDCPKGGKYL